MLRADACVCRSGTTSSALASSPVDRRTIRCDELPGNDARPTTTIADSPICCDVVPRIIALQALRAAAPPATAADLSSYCADQTKRIAHIARCTAHPSRRSPGMFGGNAYRPCRDDRETSPVVHVLGRSALLSSRSRRFIDRSRRGQTCAGDDRRGHAANDRSARRDDPSGLKNRVLQSRASGDHLWTATICR